MRVIAGSRRHLILKTVPGMAVRPTQDRTKETLFNIINPYLADCRFMDLFSGSGAIGIEALSRGARDVVMVEQSAESLACMKENLKTTKLSEEARLFSMDVFAAIPKLETEGRAFDIIFMDPPYDNELEKKVLTRLAESCLVNEDTILIAEASLQTDFSYLNELGFELYREKKYKNNQHVFIRLKEKETV